MFEGINRALMFLYNHNRINQQQLDILQRYYMSISNSNNVDLNVIKDDLKKLFEDDNFINVKINEIQNKNVSQNNSVPLQNNFQGNTVSQNNSVSLQNSFQDNSTNENNKNDNKKLIEVYDFKRGEQDYIKLTYSDGSVRILENNLNNNGQKYKGEEIFDVLKNKYGEEDITRVMHEFTKNSIEINLYDFKDFSNKNVYDQLSQNEQQLINIVMSEYPDKKVLSGSSSNMFVIQEVGKPDILVQVESLNGVYQVRPIIVNYLNDNSDGLGESKGKQMTLSTPVGKAMSNDIEKAGFMTYVLITFLAGIGIGIVSMIILNFMA